MIRRPPRSTLFPYPTLFRSLADPAAPSYVVRLFQNGPAGIQVGTARTGKPARLGADPEMIVTWAPGDRKSTRLNSSHLVISYAVFCLKKNTSVTREHTATLI